MSNKLYRAKRLKHEKRSSRLSLYAALLSIVLCMVCLAGTSWAWFTANQEVTVKSIVSAEWKMDSVEVYQIAADGNTKTVQIPVDVTGTEGDMKFSAAANTQYLVKIFVKTNARNGFALIETCDGSFYTTKSEVSFNLLLSKSSIVKVNASWGVYDGEANMLPDYGNIGKGIIPVSENDTPDADSNTKKEEDSVTEESPTDIKPSEITEETKSEDEVISDNVVELNEESSEESNEEQEVLEE